LKINDLSRVFSFYIGKYVGKFYGSNIFLWEP